MSCSIPLELHHSIGMLIYICECVKVNVVCAFSGVVSSIEVSLLCVVHSLWKNISIEMYTLVDGSHSSPGG